MVLPLPLTPFEEYMHSDDRPRWPMTFFLRLELRGRFDSAVLTSALNVALRRHPLLASLLAGDGRGGLQWVAGPGVPPPVSCGDADCEIDFPEGRQIDLRRRIGLRTWVRTAAAGEWTLWLQFHHSCCDGIGAVQFASDVLAAYSTAGLQPPFFHKLDPERLRRRGSFGLMSLGRLLRLPQEFLGLLGAIEFFSHRPPSLTLPSPTLPDASSDVEKKPVAGRYPRWINHRFSPEQSARLRQAARDRRVTLNDLLLAGLFLATDAWFAAHRPEARQRFLRIMVPTNLRTAGDEATPAANIVSMVNLDRRPVRYASGRRLLGSLSLEMAIIKRCRLGITMHHIVGLARRFGKISWLIPDNRCLSTCVLSNLGEPAALLQWAAGDDSSAGAGLELVSLDFLPPLRPWTAAAFGVSTHRGRTTITLHHDSSLPPDFARELLDNFVERLQDSCDEPELAAREPA
jgi:hypothetical protein